MASITVKSKYILEMGNIVINAIDVKLEKIREKIREKDIQQAIKRWFWKDRTREQAIQYCKTDKYSEYNNAHLFCKYQYDRVQKILTAASVSENITLTDEDVYYLEIPNISNKADQNE